MESDRIRLLRRAGEDFNATGAIDVRHVAPDVEWGLFEGSPEGDVLTGREGVRAWIANMRESFDRLVIVPHDLVELDADRVLGVYRMIARGRGSQVDVEAPLVAVWTFRDGLVSRVQSFTSREAALEAVGAGC